MTAVWNRGAADLLPAIRNLGYTRFRSCPVLQCARLDGLTPKTAAEVCAELEFRYGWAAFSNARMAQIIYWPPDNDERDDVDNLDGGFLAGEFCSEGGLSFRLGASEANGMPLWVYGENLASFLASHTDWSLQADLQDLIVETQQMKAVRESLAAVTYDVCWQATREFGLRPRIALFKGFGASEGTGK